MPLWRFCFCKTRGRYTAPSCRRRARFLQTRESFLRERFQTRYAPEYKPRGRRRARNVPAQRGFGSSACCSVSCRANPRPRRSDASSARSPWKRRRSSAKVRNARLFFFFFFTPFGALLFSCFLEGRFFPRESEGPVVASRETRFSPRFRTRFPRKTSRFERDEFSFQKLELPSQARTFGAMEPGPLGAVANGFT